eukprot:1156945-Pelagomonas_calceolata.AAC.4
MQARKQLQQPCRKTKEIRIMLVSLSLYPYAGSQAASAALSQHQDNSHHAGFSVLVPVCRLASSFSSLIATPRKFTCCSLPVEVAK